MALLIFSTGFSAKKIKESKTQFLTFEDCKENFKTYLEKSPDAFEKAIIAYKVFPCFPIKALSYILAKHSEKKWILSELSKLRILKTLSDQENLNVLENLFPYVKQKSDVEKYLTKIISLKKDFKLDFSKEQEILWARFPSHNPNRLNSPNLSVARDLMRRGQNTKALNVLKKMLSKNKNDLKIQKQLIRTQKNINRNETYLKYSESYIGSIKKQLKQRPKNQYLKNLYLNEELKNIRRIWTYRSTNQALKKLNALIANHCKISRNCAEHYWIKGRIYEELKVYSQAQHWLLRAVEETNLNDPEYQNRVWNLAWLESKLSGAQKALESSKKHLKKIRDREIFSKFYYWMSVWSAKAKEKKKYVDAIKKFHPMSFYLWSPYALGEGIELETVDLEAFKSKLKVKSEKQLVKIMNASEPTLAQSYIKHTERLSKPKKTLNWKKLKALNGMYSDLLLDLNAQLISAKTNMQFFFSRGFESSVQDASTRFMISKELIWSITRQESNFNPYARSWADAFGLMQILPKRALSFLNDTKAKRSPKVTVFNPFKLFEPHFNISVGAWLLRENLNTFDGKLPLAIASYNASVNKVEEWERRFFKGKWVQFIEEVTYRETRKYVKLVSRNLEIYKALEAAKPIKK